MNHDIFISYSKIDANLAEALCHHLESNGIRCWIAPRNISPGEDWSDAIAAGIVASRALIMLYSSGSLKSRHVKSEVRASFDGGKIIVPVRVEDINPTLGFNHLLGSSHWIDAFPEPLETYFPEILSTVSRLLSDVHPSSSYSESFEGGNHPKNTQPQRLGYLRFLIPAFLVLVILIGLVVVKWNDFMLPANKEAMEIGSKIDLGKVTAEKEAAEKVASEKVAAEEEAAEEEAAEEEAAEEEAAEKSAAMMVRVDESLNEMLQRTKPIASTYLVGVENPIEMNKDHPLNWEGNEKVTSSLQEWILTFANIPPSYPFAIEMEVQGVKTYPPIGKEFGEAFEVWRTPENVNWEEYLSWEDLEPLRNGSNLICSSGFHDFNGDSYPEVVVALGYASRSDSFWNFDFTSLQVWAFHVPVEKNKINREQNWELLLHTQFQSRVWVHGRQITTPIGSRDGWRYTLTDDQFVKTAVWKDQNGIYNPY